MNFQFVLAIRQVSSATILRKWVMVQTIILPKKCTSHIIFFFSKNLRYVIFFIIHDKMSWYDILFVSKKKRREKISPSLQHGHFDMKMQKKKMIKHSSFNTNLYFFKFNLLRLVHFIVSESMIKVGLENRLFYDNNTKTVK